MSIYLFTNYRRMTAVVYVYIPDSVHTYIEHIHVLSVTHTFQMNTRLSTHIYSHAVCYTYIPRMNTRLSPYSPTHAVCYTYVPKKLLEET